MSGSRACPELAEGPVHTDINPMYTLVLLRFTEVCRLAVLTYWGDDGALLSDPLAEKGRPGLWERSPPGRRPGLPPTRRPSPSSAPSAATAASPPYRAPDDFGKLPNCNTERTRAS